MGRAVAIGEIQGYSTAINAAGNASEAGGRLELLMDECVSSQGRVAQSNGYIAFRRRGKVYALSAEFMPAAQPSAESVMSRLSTAEERKYADRVAQMIEAGSISGAVWRGNGPTDKFSISSAPYNPESDSRREYEVPNGAKWVRARNRKIIFYCANLPEHKACTSDRRRKYFPVPENASKARRSLGAFEWLVPEGDAYLWKKL